MMSPDEYDIDYDFEAHYTKEIYSHGLSFTLKLPPQYDGITPWFDYEEALEEWAMVTEVSEEKQGPLCLTRLQGRATEFKSLFD